MMRAETERLRLELSLEIARDAQRAATEFWKNWLWYACEERSEAPNILCERLSQRFNVAIDLVQRQWTDWYQLLTSWDLAAAMTGRDVRAARISYGSVHWRTR
jgi:hypothetical protein